MYKNNEAEEEEEIKKLKEIKKSKEINRSPEARGALRFKRNQNQSSLDYLLSGFKK